MIPGSLAAPAAGGGSVTLELNISTNTASYNIFNSISADYVAGATEVILTIDTGVYVYGSNTATPALTVGGFTAGDVVTIINNGNIIGCGGAGGPSVPQNTNSIGIAGSVGGVAIDASGYNVEITNNGIISGGGGGGGSGGTTTGTTSGYSGAGGTGRGSASTLASGATGSTNQSGSAAGGFGSATATGGTGGRGTFSSYGGAGGGGGGGGYASSGGLGGANIININGGAAGGAGGACTAGNANITWTVVGTRYGTLA